VPWSVTRFEFDMLTQRPPLPDLGFLPDVSYLAEKIGTNGKNLEGIFDNTKFIGYTSIVFGQVMIQSISIATWRTSN